MLSKDVQRCCSKGSGAHLAGSIDDVAIIVLSLVLDVLVEDILDRRVVRVDKGVLNIANDEG